MPLQQADANVLTHTTLQTHVVVYGVGLCFSIYLPVCCVGRHCILAGAVV